MTDRIWMGTLVPEHGAPSRAPGWRDAALLPGFAEAPEVAAVRSYAAFNGARQAVVAQLRAGAPVDWAPAIDAPAGLAVRQAVAELAYEIVQPGVQDAAEAALLYEVRFAVPPGWAGEFDRWYEQEHLAMIYGSPYWSATRRYRFAQPGPGGATHLALHYLNDARGFDAPQLKASRVTPWRNKFLGERWFTDVEKVIYFRQTPAP